MARTYPTADDNGKLCGWAVKCPGCKNHHEFLVVGVHPRLWIFDGNRDLPTFHPSMNCRCGPMPEGTKRAGKIDVCHSIVTAGRIQFLGDCTHELRGQTVDLPEIDPVIIQMHEVKITA